MYQCIFNQTILTTEPSKLWEHFNFNPRFAKQEKYRYDSIRVTDFYFSFQEPCPVIVCVLN